MRSDEEIREFLRGELADAVREHARRRQEIYAAIRRWPFAALAIAGAIAAYYAHNAWLLAAPFAYGFAVFARAKQRVREDCKHSLIGPALRFWNPTLEYDPASGVPEAVFTGSALFEGERWNRYRGEDRVRGRIGETSFELSELRVVRARSGKKSDVELFRGLFVVADFHKSFRGRTYLLPDRAERAVGVFGRTLQRLAGVSGCQLVELESPEFERDFCAYASDPVEARYILSPKLMEQILEFRRSTGRALRIAFADEKLYLALPSTADLFEQTPDSLDQAEHAMRAWIADLEFATRVIEELGLNTRIWSKGAAA